MCTCIAASAMSSVPLAISSELLLLVLVSTIPVFLNLHMVLKIVLLLNRVMVTMLSNSENNANAVEVESKSYVVAKRRKLATKVLCACCLNK